MKLLQEKMKSKKVVFGVLMVLLSVLGSMVVPNKVMAATKYYSISYSANGGTDAPATQQKAEDKTITISKKKPKRDGYEFLGWATKGTSKTVAYKPGSKYSANRSIKLYAVWKADTYKISFNANGGSGAPASQTKTHGERLRLSTKEPTRTGYTFKGWSEKKNSSVVQYKSGAYFMQNKATVLYAVWKAKTFTVKYNANGGTDAPAPQTKEYGKTLQLTKKKPKRANHTFVGWIVDKDKTTLGYAPGDKYTKNESITLYAFWRQDTFKVNFYPNGGTGGMTSQIKQYGQTMEISKGIPRRSGYKFIGWGLEKDSTTVSYYPGDEYKINRDLNLFAIWGKTMMATYTDQHIVGAISTDDADLGVVDATLVYTEDYKKKGTKIYCYNHETYLNLDWALLNDCYGISANPPMVVTHENMITGTRKTFTVTERTDLLNRGDYTFSRVNRKKVVYNLTDDITGSCGYQVLFNDMPQGRGDVQIKITEGGKIKLSSSAVGSEKNIDEKYYSLGKAVGNNLEEEKSKGDIQTDSYMLYSSKEFDKKKTSNIIATYGGSAIYTEEIENAIEKRKTMGTVTEEDIENIIYDEILRRKLNIEVEKNGCEKSSQDAEVYISELRKALLQADDNEKYLSFLKGLNMKEDVYWEYTKEAYRKKMGRCEYLEKLYTEYQNGLNLSISDEYQGIDALIKEKANGNEVTKCEFMRMIKDIILEKSGISINKDVIESCLWI